MLQALHQWRAIQGNTTSTIIPSSVVIIRFSWPLNNPILHSPHHVVELTSLANSLYLIIDPRKCSTHAGIRVRYRQHEFKLGGFNRAPEIRLFESFHMPVYALAVLRAIEGVWEASAHHSSKVSGFLFYVSLRGADAAAWMTEADAFVRAFAEWVLTNVV